MPNGKNNESWGAWGPNQPAQPDPEKPLLDVLEAGDTAPPSEHEQAPRINELPGELQNPVTRDLRVEADDTDEVRIATEPPRSGR